MYQSNPSGSDPASIIAVPLRPLAGDVEATSDDELSAWLATPEERAAGADSAVNINMVDLVRIAGAPSIALILPAEDDSVDLLSELGTGTWEVDISEFEAANAGAGENYCKWLVKAALRKAAYVGFWAQLSFIDAFDITAFLLYIIDTIRLLEGVQVQMEDELGCETAQSTADYFKLGLAISIFTSAYMTVALIYYFNRPAKNDDRFLSNAPRATRRQAHAHGHAHAHAHGHGHAHNHDHGHSKCNEFTHQAGHIVGIGIPFGVLGFGAMWTLLPCSWPRWSRALLGLTAGGLNGWGAMTMHGFNLDEGMHEHHGFWNMLYNLFIGNILNKPTLKAKFWAILETQGVFWGHAVEGGGFIAEIFLTATGLNAYPAVGIPIGVILAGFLLTEGISEAVSMGTQENRVTEHLPGCSPRKVCMTGKDITLFCSSYLHNLPILLGGAEVIGWILKFMAKSILPRATYMVDPLVLEGCLRIVAMVLSHVLFAPGNMRGFKCLVEDAVDKGLDTVGRDVEKAGRAIQRCPRATVDTVCCIGFLGSRQRTPPLREIQYPPQETSALVVNSTRSDYQPSWL